jgi:hypothetical protein
MSKNTLYAWIRAKVWYPSFYYSNKFYRENFENFRYPNDVSKMGKLRIFRWFCEEQKVNIVATFGYDQIGIHLYTDVQKKEEYSIIEIKEAIYRIIKGYQNFKEYFLKDVCPLKKDNDNSDFKLVSEKILVELFEFIDGMDVKHQKSLLNELESYLYNYSSDNKIMLFDSNIKIKTNEDFQTQEPVFDSIYVTCENISLFIYHYIATQALALDPSHSIIDASKWGFFSSMALLDLHYDIKELYESIEEERVKLKNLLIKHLPLGLDTYRERSIELEDMAKRTEKNLEDIIDLSKQIYDSLKKPFFYQKGRIGFLKERPDLAIKVTDLIRNMDSLPHTQFEAGGILELHELGGLRNIRESVDEINDNIELLEIRSNRRINVLEIILSIPILICIIGIVLSYQLDISRWADILQIVTFVLALLILLIRIRPKIRKIY